MYARGENSGIEQLMPSALLHGDGCNRARPAVDVQNKHAAASFTASARLKWIIWSILLRNVVTD
jgi:hypothetical protein